MALGLRHLEDVDDRRHVFASRGFGGAAIGFMQSGVIPALDAVDIEALVDTLLAAEAGHDLRDLGLGDLKLVGHRDTVVIVPDRDDHGHLQHADGVDRLPEHSLGAARVADRAVGDLVSVVGESGELT
jgi:hypothetical protein